MDPGLPTALGHLLLTGWAVLEAPAAKAVSPVKEGKGKKLGLLSEPSRVV